MRFSHPPEDGSPGHTWSTLRASSDTTLLSVSRVRGARVSTSSGSSSSTVPDRTQTAQGVSIIADDRELTSLSMQGEQGVSIIADDKAIR